MLLSAIPSWSAIFVAAHQGLLHRRTSTRLVRGGTEEKGFFQRSLQKDKTLQKKEAMSRVARRAMPTLSAEKKHWAACRDIATLA